MEEIPPLLHRGGGGGGSGGSWGWRRSVDVGHRKNQMLVEEEMFREEQ